MNNGNVPYGLGYMIVTLCRILKPQEEWEGTSSGAISSMKVAVPREVLEETAATGKLDLLDLWVEDEFGFPWLLAHGENMEFMSEESYRQWSTEL